MIAKVAKRLEILIRIFSSDETLVLNWFVAQVACGGNQNFNQLRNIFKVHFAVSVANAERISAGIGLSVVVWKSTNTQLVSASANLF